MEDSNRWFSRVEVIWDRLLVLARLLDYYDKASIYRYAICLKESDIPIGYEQ